MNRGPKFLMVSTTTTTTTRGLIRPARGRCWRKEQIYRPTAICGFPTSSGTSSVTVQYYYLANNQLRYAKPTKLLIKFQYFSNLIAWPSVNAIFILAISEVQYLTRLQSSGRENGLQSYRNPYHQSSRSDARAFQSNPIKFFHRHFWLRLPGSFSVFQVVLSLSGYLLPACPAYRCQSSLTCNDSKNPTRQCLPGSGCAITGQTSWNTSAYTSTHLFNCSHFP